MKELLAAFLVLTGCDAPQREQAAGEQTTIVSLNPCADAILAEVANPAQVLAVSHYSHDPRASSMPLDVARRYRATGGTVEEVLALDPDVVVASTFIAPATRAAFERLGVRVETVGTVRTVAESGAQVMQLARLAGHPERGTALVGRIEAAVNRSQSTKPAIPAVLWQPDGIVPGDGELVSELMRGAGLTNHSAARGFGQADYLSLERLLSDPPEILLVAGRERGQRHRALDALSSMRTAAFEPSLLYCGGPTIIRASERLAAIRRSLR